MRTMIHQSILAGFLVTTLAYAAVVVGPNATLAFETGRAALTQESEAKVRDMVRQARGLGKIDEIKIAVRDDEAFVIRIQEHRA